MPPPQRHITPVRKKSDQPENNPVNRTRQPSKRDEAFAVRFSDALQGRDRAWLARQTGLSASTLHDYSRGAIPSADRAFLIADAVGVDVRWLVTGQGTAAGDEDEWVRLPYRSLSGDSASEAERRAAPVRRDWLRREFGPVETLWVTDMPSNAFPEVAREGDPILCRDAGGLVEGGFYLVQLETALVVRRLTATPGGQVLTTNDAFTEPMAPAFSQAPAVPFLVGRVIGTLVKPV